MSYSDDNVDGDDDADADYSFEVEEAEKTFLLQGTIALLCFISSLYIIFQTINLLKKKKRFYKSKYKQKTVN